MWQNVYHICAKRGMDRMLLFICRSYRGQIDAKDMTGRTAVAWAFELGEEKCLRVHAHHPGAARSWSEAVPSLRKHTKVFRREQPAQQNQTAGHTGTSGLTSST